MTYQEAITFIRENSAAGCTPGLSRVRELLRRLGNPQDRIPCIHIAGTNGKGSTAAMIAAMLQEAGCRTGLFTSPHLVRYNERIRMNGEEIPEEAFCRAAEQVRAAAEGMEETPSEFERFTPMAFLYFVEAGCDIAVIETGLGGRLDATNVIAHPVVDVITHIALDHTEYLGNTIEAIAGEKAGIIKPGADVVLMKQEPIVEEVVRAHFAEVNCASCEGSCRLQVTEPNAMRILSSDLEGQRFSYRHRQDLLLNLPGLYQQENVMTALDTIDALIKRGWQIPEEAIRTGLSHVSWPARFEILQRNPLVILDGAHNEDGARRLSETLTALLPDQKVIFVIGVLADKNYIEMLRILVPHAHEMIAAEPSNVRALRADVLADAVRTQVDCATFQVIVGGSILESVKLACDRCPDDGIICIAGSLYQAGEVRTYLQSKP